MNKVSSDNNKLFKDSLRLEIVASQCSNQLEKAQTFEMEQLHVILNTIGDIKRCVFYKAIEDSNVLRFQAYLQVIPSKLENDDIDFSLDMQTNDMKKYVRFGNEVAFQLPIYGMQHQCIGKMQIFFFNQQSLFDKVKIECLEKLQSCLSAIGNYCPTLEKLIIAHSFSFEEGTAQISNCQDLSIVINVNDSFLDNNIEI